MARARLISSILGFSAVTGMVIWLVGERPPRPIHLPPIQRVMTVGELELQVVDRSGLVEGVRDGAPFLAADRGITVANPPGTKRELVVGWTSTACDTRPKIVLDAIPGGARLVFHGDVRRLPCESMGVGRAVILDLSVALPAEAVTIRSHTEVP